MAIDKDVSMVYANDTVDFGTIDLSRTSKTTTAVDGTLVKEDDRTRETSESDFDSNTEVSQIPQHTDDTIYGDYLTADADSSVIDNRKLEYIPIQLACGLTTYCSPDVLRHCPMVLRSVQADLAQAFRMLPIAVHSLLRRTNLWLNWNGYAYGPKVHPKILRHVTTHHHPAWLMNVACDTPSKAMGIEIYSCIDYQNMRLHWNGSGLLLHELCHLIHQCCLEDGLDNRRVESLYERADASGKYERVLRRDWAGKMPFPMIESSTRSNDTLSTAERNSSETGRNDQPSDFDLAYAMVDKKEFFAEMSVAFLCHGYRGLSKADPNRMEFCTPPLLHPDAIERIRVMAAHREDQLAHENNLQGVPSSIQEGYVLVQNEDIANHCESDAKHECCFSPFSAIGGLFRKPFQRRNHGHDDSLSQLIRTMDPIFRDDALTHSCATIYHCNKFYPFTRGQLKHYDPEVFHGVSNLWAEISMWDDPFASIRTRKRLEGPCARRCGHLFFC